MSTFPGQPLSRLAGVFIGRLTPQSSELEFLGVMVLLHAIMPHDWFSPVSPSQLTRIFG
jgi:hypothetical protein